ncbi:MAG: phosphoglucosamine mutase [Alphaproteobacteria bacterium]
MRSKRQLFGTDGIRGKANEWPMTPDQILKLALAVGHNFTRGCHRHTVVIGKDTRLSGYMIENALTAGFIAMGMDVTLLGPLPTPAVAMLTRSLRADLGVMISASHNPFSDNGIKLFDPQGHKLPDAKEAAIEACLADNKFSLVTPTHLGKARRLDDAGGRYSEFVKATLPRDFRLEGLKIVVDCAHGAAYKVAPKILWELGAEVIPLGVSPNGININEDCGATALAAACRAVVDHKADLGIVLDGDGDRLIMIDAEGGVLDGDHLLAIIATCWQKSGELSNPVVVGTHMSNLGLERYLESKGITFIRSAVGDRYVIEAMRQHGGNIGGEQSGHIILSDYVVAGDGLLAALQVLRAARELGEELGCSKIGQLFTPVPQVIKSVRLNSDATMTQQKVREAFSLAEEQLATRRGSFLVRHSGTEPLIRIMGQGDDHQLLESVIDNVCSVLEEMDRIG